jgi:phospholipid transport system transporter-binding protein
VADRAQGHRVIVSKAKLEALGGGRYRVVGVIDAMTAGDLLEQSIARFETSGDLEVDLAGVPESDSAGLALLIEWIRRVRLRRQKIRFSNVPAQINALARISEVEDLLALAEEKPEQPRQAVPA